MKFLVLYRDDPARSAMIPPPAIADIVEASGHWLDEAKKTGRILDAYFLGNEHGGAMIVEADRAGELLDIIDGPPARVLCDVETFPLVPVPEWREGWPKAKAQMLDAFKKRSGSMPK